MNIEMPLFDTLDRNVVLAHVALTGLLDEIPRIPSPIRRDDFGIISRETPSLEIDTVHLCVNRDRGGISERLKGMCSLFTGELIALFSESDPPELQDVLDLVMMNSLCSVGVYAIRALSENVWRGAVTNTKGRAFYREFNSLDTQIENVIDFESNGFDNLFDAIVAVKEELKYLAREGAVLPEWCIVADPVIIYQMGDGIKMLADPRISWTAEGEVLTSNVYVLPLTVDGKPSTYLEYVDYSEIGIADDKIRFWTDGGLFLWTIEQQNWDFKLKAQVEAAIRLTHPQLAIKISNVSTPLLKEKS